MIWLIIALVISVVLNIFFVLLIAGAIDDPDDPMKRVVQKCFEEGKPVTWNTEEGMKVHESEEPTL